MGARLLERTSRQVALTEAGKVLYREAQALLRQAEDVRVLVRRVDAGLRGRLRIGFVGSMLYRACRRCWRPCGPSCRRWSTCWPS